MGTVDIILKSSVRCLGSAGSVCSVRVGYANNFLIPSGYAVLATAQNLLDLESKRGALALEEEKRYEIALQQKQEIESVMICIGKNVNESGSIFGSITTKEIEGILLDKYSINVARQMISIRGETIKKIGVYKNSICVYLYGDVSACPHLSVLSTRDSERFYQEFLANGKEGALSVLSESLSSDTEGNKGIKGGKPTSTKTPHSNNNEEGADVQGSSSFIHEHTASQDVSPDEEILDDNIVDIAETTKTDH